MCGDLEPLSKAGVTGSGLEEGVGNMVQLSLAVALFVVLYQRSTW